MIKQFNKDGAVALYKREFAACLTACDYEGAIDYLLKYSEKTENPDFHMAMGVLYFLMTQDSDDSELLPLAYREFMMHLIAHPDSRAAYRNLLAVAILRHDANSIAEVSDFIGRRGQDVQAIVSELSEYGLDIFNDEVDYIDFENMFTPADYGAITDSALATEREVEPPIASSDKQSDVSISKVIAFRGNADKSKDGVMQASDKIIRIKSDGEPIEEKIDFGDMFDMMMQLVRGEQDEIEYDGDDDFSLVSAEAEDGPSDIRAKIALRNAQGYCVNGDYEKALCELDSIRRDTGRLYYCAECVRSNIMMDLNRYDDAQTALDRAFAVVPNGALAGTLQCALYEVTGRVEKIPDVLKSIDVADYIDSDHVYRAMQLAVKYCSIADATMLAEEYIDEFNSFDLRSVYAQMLYNAGERERATKELRMLSRIQYDNFNAHYNYIAAKAGVDEMPVEDQTPKRMLSIMVDNFMAIANSEYYPLSTQLIGSELFRYGLEVFLTLEFRQTRKIVKTMFKTLHIIAADRRLETQMRNALVSPYVEDLAKAVILGKLLTASCGKTDFLSEQSFCPISCETVPKANDDCDEGYYMAYAVAVMCCRKALPFLAEYYQAVRQSLSGAGFPSCDVANFLWRTVKSKFKYKDKDVDERVHYAFGYDTKAQANAAYKSMAELFTKF